MSSMPRVNVTPVSGSGWMVAGEPRGQVPQPFTMALQSCEPKRWFGLVLDNGHEFVGRPVELKQDHDEWTGEVEIIVEPACPSDGISSGPGLVGLAPPIPGS